MLGEVGWGLFLDRGPPENRPDELLELASHQKETVIEYDASNADAETPLATLAPAARTRRQVTTPPRERGGFLGDA
jgi:hypothetical protein